MWAEKYRPKRLDEMLGNKTAVDVVRKFDWKKPLLVYGGTGAGKTALIDALASETGFEVVGLDDDNVDESGSIAVTGSLYGSRRLVVVDNADKFRDMKKLSSFLEESRVPTVLTTSDIKSRRLASVRRKCVEVRLRRQQPASIANHLEVICRSENVKADKEALVEIARNSGGDMRSAITDLETLSKGRSSVTKKDVENLYRRDTAGDIYKTIGVVFNGRDIKEVVESTWDLDSEPRNTLFWIEENAPNVIQGKQQLSEAFHYISRAELFLARAEGSRYWGFWRYANELMTAGVNASAGKTRYAMYRFPSYFMSMSRTKADRAAAKSIGDKIRKRIHESGATVCREYIPLLRLLLKKGRVSIETLKKEYMLSEDDVGYLGEA